MTPFTKSILIIATLLAGACTTESGTTKSGLIKADFQAEVDGQKTELYTLTNQNGVEACITNFGGRLVSMMVPDRTGELCDVVLGFDNINDYINVPTDFGASVGRYANRIKEGKFTLDGVTYDLPKNNFGHCLHGGTHGWQNRVYEMIEKGTDFVTLQIVSPAADQNFPGEVTARVTYRLTDQNALDISYEATTDAPTVINLTNHSYFNLSGSPQKSIFDDVLWVNANEFTPVDSTFMTTGEILPVAGTPMDFRAPRHIGEQIGYVAYDQIRNGDGYDHNWVLATAGKVEEKAAELYSQSSGIIMGVYTTEPGIQVYTGNFLDGTVTGKKEIVYNKRTAICLETQHYPDSPNKANWPSTVVRPGETYTSRCIYTFSTDKQ